MKRIPRAASGIAIMFMVVSGCAAIDTAKNVKDAAKGLAGAEKDAQEFSAKLEKAKTLTFTAVYTVKKPGSADETIVVSQKPPKSSYKQGDTLLIDDGLKVYSCTKADGTDSCLELAPHSEAGLLGAGAGVGGFAFAFNPAAFTGLYLAAAIAPGVNASKIQRDFAGLTSDCTTLTFTEGADKGKKLEGCTSTEGVFTYSLATDDSETRLVKYEASVSDSAFELPAKPKTQQELVNDATSTTATSSTSSTSTTSTTEPSTTTSSVADTTTSSTP